MSAFNKFRRVLLCLAFALFLGLPIALTILNAIGPSSLMVVVIVAVIFMIGAGIGGYALAKRIEKSAAQRTEGSMNNAELYQAREKRMEMITRTVYALITVWIFYDIIFTRSAAPSIFGIIIDLVLAIIFLFLFLFYDKNKSPWTKKFYLAMVLSCIVYLVVGLINFSIAEQQRPVSVSLAPISTQEVTTTPSVVSSTVSTSSDGQIGTHIFKIKELGLEMTVPNNLDLTYVISVQSGSGSNSVGTYQSTTTNAFFSSYSLTNLVQQLDPQHMTCGEVQYAPLGSIGTDDMTPRNFVPPDEKLVGNSYVYGIFTPSNSLHPCSSNPQIQALIVKQSAELSAAYNTIQSY